MLVMDLVSPRIESPSERGGVLRSLGGLLPPSCSLQWSGQPGALRRFLERAGLPHRVAGILALDSRPLRLTKEISVEMPASRFTPEDVTEVTAACEPAFKKARTGT